MPFQYILANLLAKNEGAQAVLFIDETGETVDLACTDFTPYQMKVVGAYVGIYIRQLDDFLKNNSLGATELLHIQKKKLDLLAAPLPDGYFLALVQRRPAFLARSKTTLLDARDELEREVFT